MAYVLDGGPEMIKRIVVCAANQHKDNGFLVLGPRHFDPLMRKHIKLSGYSHHDFHTQGFIDQFGIFMDRKEALAVAANSNQLNIRRPKTTPTNELFSEDLY